MPQPPAEVTLSVADVDRLLASQHPALRGVLQPVANGWDNEVFRLGADLAVRLPRRAAAAAAIEHEQRWLPELALRLPLPVPAPVAIGVPEGDYPWHWSVVPWFAGRSGFELTPAQRDRFVEPLAAFLRALHRPAPVDAPRSRVRGVALRTREGAVRPRLAGAPALRTAWEDAVAAPEWGAAAVWVHGDVHPGNLVADDRGGLSAVIDFSDLCAGDPACDLAIAWTGFTAAGRAAFREGLGDAYDEPMWRRARGWAVAMATLVQDADDAGLRAMASHTADQLAGD